MSEEIDIKAIQAEHKKYRSGDNFCYLCQENWPCQTIRSCDEIERLRAEVERGESFIAEVVFDYLEINKVFQCPWCLWIPGRELTPVHECDAVKWMKELLPRRAAIAQKEVTND